MEGRHTQTNGHAVIDAIHPRGRGCRHHWMLETPNGARSAGTCKSCGRSRSFANAFEDIMELQRRARLEALMLSKPAARTARPAAA